MKIARTWTSLGVLIAGLLCSHASIQAQPARAPVPVPTEPARPAGDRTPADDEAIVIDDPDKPWSQGVSMENRSAARDLCLEGNRLLWVPLFARAAERYTAALALWQHPAFYFNLALAQLNLGQDVEARASLALALAHGEEPLGEKLYQEGQKRLEEVTRQLGRLRVICRTPGAEVTVDGATLFTGPGIHEAWVKAKGGVNAVDCDLDCTKPVCGDGIHNSLAGEECDDANTSDADACVSVAGACRHARCGDGHLRDQGQKPEMCDDGNDNVNDGCPSGPGGSCQPAACGDGYINTANGEICDPGNADKAPVGCMVSALCTNACTKCS